MLIFVGIMLVIWGLFAACIAVRLIVPARLSGASAVAAWAGLAFAWLVLPSVFILRMAFPGFPEIHPLEITAYLVFGVVTMLVPLLLFRDIGWFGAWVLRLLPAEAPARLRLLNMTGIGVLAVMLSMLAAGLWGFLRMPMVQTVELAIPGLPGALEGYRIVQLTDLHIGATFRARRVARIVDVANALAPDAFILTGDVADGLVKVLRPDAAPLARLRARDGKFFVTGNHEYFSDYKGWMAEIPRLGFTVLDNSHRLIRRGKAVLVMAGIPDASMRHRMMSGRMAPADPVAALRGSPRDAAKILLSHQPPTAPAAAAAGADAQISGHVHGGQYFPWSFVIPRVVPYGKSGLSRVDGMLLYVSRGTGAWGPPLRLGVPAEITLFRLASAPRR